MGDVEGVPGRHCVERGWYCGQVELMKLVMLWVTIVWWDGLNEGLMPRLRWWGAFLFFVLPLLVLPIS